MAHRKDFVDHEHGTSPKLKEISEGTKLYIPSAVCKHIKQLETDGKIKRIHKSRSRIFEVIG